jgi:nitrogen regulatory protein P-II 1
MKKIEAIIKPSKMDEVRSALTDFGVNVLTISEVEDCGQRSSQTESLHVRGHSSDFSPRIKLEFVVPDDISSAVCAAIVEVVRPRLPGDGHILISQVDEIVRFRREEKGQLAAH